MGSGWGWSQIAGLCNPLRLALEAIAGSGKRLRDVSVPIRIRDVSATFGVLGAVKDRIDDDAIVGGLVENLEWESANRCVANLVHGDWK